MAKGVYRRYRGSRPRKGILIPTLVSLCVLAAIVLIYVNFNLEDGGDGTTILSLPFTDETMVFGEPNAKLVVEEPVDVVVEVEREVPEYETRIEKLQILSLDENFDDNLKAITDKNTVAIIFKDDSGEIADTEAAKDACNKIKAAGFNACAVISCFCDDAYAKENKELACVDEDEEIWEDKSKNSWLNPYKEENAEYICQMIEKAYDAGFSEILLTNAAFPAGDEIYYDSDMKKEEATTSFLEKVKTLCDEKEGLEVAIYLDEEESGQAIEFIAGNFYRIYTNNANIYNEVATLMPAENIEQRIVAIEKIEPEE